MCPADWSSGPGAVAVGATGAKAAALLRGSAGPPLHPRACGPARHRCPQPRAHDLELGQVPAPHRTDRSSPGGLCKGTDQVVTAVGQGVLKPELLQHRHDGLGPCDCPQSPGQNCPGSRVCQGCPPTPPGSSPGSSAAQGKPAPPWVWVPRSWGRSWDGATSVPSCRLGSQVKPGSRSTSPPVAASAEPSSEALCQHEAQESTPAFVCARVTHLYRAVTVSKRIRWDRRSRQEARSTAAN